MAIHYTYVFHDNATVDGEPIYVGKGQNARFLDHLRSKPELLGKQLAVVINFHDSNMDALDAEAQLICDLFEQGANLLNVQVPGSRLKRPPKPEPIPEPEWFEVYAASFPTIKPPSKKARPEPVADPCDSAPELATRFAYRCRAKLDQDGFKEMVRATIKVARLANANPDSLLAASEAHRMRELVEKAKASIRDAAKVYREYQTVEEEAYTFRSHDWHERRSYEVTRSNLERSEYEPRKFMETWIPGYPGKRRVPTIPTTKVEIEPHYAFRNRVSP